MTRKTKKPAIQLLKKDTYLVMIQNAAGSQLWKNSYALVNDKKTDIVHNGNTSYAFFVSSILKLFNLIQDIHLTVRGLEKDLQKSGWRSIPISPKMPKGSVLIWEKQGGHLHTGFYIGNKKAVSIWVYHNFPIIHSWNTYSKSREIIRVYSNQFLQKAR